MRRERFISRPSPTEAIRTGWDAMKVYFLEFLLVTLVVAAIGSIGSLFSNGNGFGSAGFSFFITIFVSGPLSFGASLYYLKAVRGDEFELTDIFTGFKENYLKVVLANLAYISIIMLGFLLLIIPGIIFAIRLSFVPYLVMDDKLEPIEAIKTSWEMTKDYSVDIFVLGLLAILIFIGGLLLLIIGILPALMLVHAAFASFYLGVRNEYEVYESDEFFEEEQ